MTPSLPPLRLTGARVMRGGELVAGEVVLAHGRIEGHGPPGTPAVDLSGYLVLPGIVDAYGAAFERHVRPRDRVAVPLGAALLATDREAAAAGVTTAHLAQGWSWEGGHRDPDRAEALLAAIEAYAPRALTDLRPALRVETHTVGTGDRLIEAVRRHRVGFALFGDRLSGAGALGPARFAAIAARAAALGVPPEDHAARMRAAAARAGEVPRHVLRLAEAFDAMGVAFGSDGDRDGEAREAWSMRGARICAFPAARPPAASARAVGDAVLLGAPEAAGFAEPSGRASAAELVEGGLCDALASDYAYPALAGAAFRLAEEGVLPLGRAWALVSEAPARLLRLADRGRIAPGLRADLCVVDAETRAVEVTICAGRVVAPGGAGGRALPRRRRGRARRRLTVPAAPRPPSRGLPRTRRGPQAADAWRAAGAGRFVRPSSGCHTAVTPSADTGRATAADRRDPPCPPDPHTPFSWAPSPPSPPRARSRSRRGTARRPSSSGRGPSISWTRCARASSRTGSRPVWARRRGAPSSRSATAGRRSSSPSTRWSRTWRPHAWARGSWSATWPSRPTSSSSAGTPRTTCTPPRTSC